MMRYSENGESFAKRLMEMLEDNSSLAYYRCCVATYPRVFLEDTMFYIANMPEDLITVSRAELFKIIIGMTYVEED